MKYAIIIMTCCFSLVVGNVAHAALTNEERAVLGGDRKFDVYYEVTQSVMHVIKGVKIIDIKVIGGRKFIECYHDAIGISKDTNNFIDFESVKAIIPSGTVVDTVYEQKN
jgi:hypothetical protein